MRPSTPPELDPGGPAHPWQLHWRGVLYTIRPADPAELPGGLICEPPVEGRIPGFLLRSEIHRHIQATHPGRPVLFTDASRSARIRRWVVEGPGAPAVSRELVQWQGDRRGAGPGPDRGIAPQPVERTEAGQPGVETALALEILKRAHARIPLLQPGGRAWRLIQEQPRRYGLPSRTGDPPPVTSEARALGSRQLIHDLIADPSGPEVLRAFWRTLRDLRVLDPACGDGSRLMAVVRLLAGFQHACLDQMRIWIDEVRLERRSRRAEFLRDFRVALARADGRSGQEAPRDRRVLETVLLTNVYAVDPDPAAAAACLARLHAHLRETAGSDAAPREACNVRSGDPEAGIRDRATLVRALAGARDAPRRLRSLLEEAEAVDRADRFVRRMRLEHRADADSTRAGLLAIRRRRAKLARQMDPLAARNAGVDHSDQRAVRRWLAEKRPLHLFVEWPAHTPGPGFHRIGET